MVRLQNAASRLLALERLADAPDHPGPWLDDSSADLHSRLRQLEAISPTRTLRLMRLRALV